MITPVQSIRLKPRNRDKWMIAGAVLGSLLFLILIIVASFTAFRQKDSAPGQTRNLPLAAVETSSERLEYRDPTCHVRFTYPANWPLSQTAIPLPGTPLHTVTFDGPVKPPRVGQSAILSYLCLDAKLYSFEQLLAGSSNFKPQVEVVGGKQWQRLGSFAATTLDDKLLVFYMPFTKYDLKPRPSYEEVFLTFLQSVSTTN